MGSSVNTDDFAFGEEFNFIGLDLPDPELGLDPELELDFKR
jgi:hypothetical protein